MTETNDMLCATVCQLTCAHQTSQRTFSEGSYQNVSLPYSLLTAHLLIRRISCVIKDIIIIIIIIIIYLGRYVPEGV